MAVNTGSNKSGSPAKAAGSATVAVPRMAGAPSAPKPHMSTVKALGLTAGSLAAGYGLGAMAAASAAHAGLSYGARVAGRKAARQALQARMTGNAAAVNAGRVLVRMTG